MKKTCFQLACEVAAVFYFRNNVFLAVRRPQAAFYLFLFLAVRRPQAHFFVKKDTQRHYKLLKVTKSDSNSD